MNWTKNRPCVVCMNCVEIVFSSSELNLMLLLKIE